MCEPPSLSKRPKGARPDVLLKQDTVFYNGGTLRMSEPRSGYRCFAKLTVRNPSDKLFSWGAGSNAEKKSTWEKAPDHIDNIRAIET